MFEIPVFEAKNRLSEVLRRVERGEDVTITRRGVPVAVVTAPGRRAAPPGNPWREWRALMGRVKATPDEIAEWKAQGRP
jgi:prevent-host-death family protein